MYFTCPEHILWTSNLLMGLICPDIWNINRKYTKIVALSQGPAGLQYVFKE